MELDEDDRSDNEDEKPTVVVLREGDLTAEEAEQLKKGGAKDDSGAEHNDIGEFESLAFSLFLCLCHS